jgi:hypothetical protein
MAATLQHARRNDLRRAVLLAGYARSKLAQQRLRPYQFELQMQQRVSDRALAEHSAASVETWLRVGEGLSEAQAAAIAFDAAPLDGQCT